MNVVLQYAKANAKVNLSNGLLHVLPVIRRNTMHCRQGQTAAAASLVWSTSTLSMD
jgi:hypothetical protein